MILEVHGLTKRFGGVSACETVSLNVEEGAVVGVIGPNGAGKTTLFDCIAGAYHIDAGSVIFKGERIDHLRPDQRARRGVARTFQNLRPFSRMTLLDNVAVGALCRTASIRRARSRALELLDYVGLTDKASTYADQLSTGQRKRLELARALATEPRLLLLDEVTGGVDQTAIPGLLELVGRLQQSGLTLLVIEHNMKVIRRLSSRLIAMHLGHVIADGTVDEVVSDRAVIEAYLGKSYAGNR